MSFSQKVVGILAALALAGALVPALASAQTAPYYYGNCNNYPYASTYPYNTTYPANTTYPYNNTYPYNTAPGYTYPTTYSNGCPQGNLFVYVQVQAQTNSFYNQPVSNFSISVAGGTAFPTTFPGNTNGQMVSVVGSYSVTAAPFQGFTPSYSSGCTGSLSQGQQNSCVVTETPIYPANYQPYNQYQYNQYPYTTPYVQPYTQPGYNTGPTVYVTPTYVPKLPNTGFEPQDGATIAFAVVALIAMAFLTFPYVRKALAIVLG